MDDIRYHQCKHCDHFVEPNDCLNDGFGEKIKEGETAVYFRDEHGEFGVAKFIHLDDGDQEYDHDAEPGEEHTGREWKLLRPDLFTKHPDGAIGPNSSYHNRRGKKDD